ncbi:ASST-domain-containing protein [Microdochium bolleyi]|uniref:ASST-domain-containing protein n=1 Tax=Microdochium bolleyi TaxID=196109 RepID=A0A136IW81_9PEZI|nr:ASST-domain-containing protein [Microdochium bolleyi]
MSLAILATLVFWAAHMAGAATMPGQHGNHPLWDHHSFKTEPTFSPPFVDVQLPGVTAPGHIMFAQFGPEATQNAAMIMNQDGQLVWQTDPSMTRMISNLTPAKLLNEDILLYWESSSSQTSQLPVNSQGVIRILDSSYQWIFNITLNDPALSTHGQFASLIDPHEAFITPSGTLLVLAYDVRPWDLSPVGGPRKGWIRDGVVYEINLPDNEILFHWRGSDHIPINESYAGLPNATTEDGSEDASMAPWDYLHLNSVTAFEDGILLSSRHTCNVYYIEKGSGIIRWTLNGDRNGEFLMTPPASFCWQHDVHGHRSQEGRMLLTMFNNRNNGTIALDESYGMLIDLKLTGQRSVTGITMYMDPNESLSSVAGGSMQVLDNGNAFLGYGTQPVMKEYHMDGRLASTWRFGSPGSHLVPGAGSYRARKYEWRGCPVKPPKIAGCRHKNGTADVWMSWNGATEMRLWNVITDSLEKSPSIALTGAPCTGFETKANVKIRDKAWVQAEAVGGCDGATELTRSEVVAVEEYCAEW